MRAYIDESGNTGFNLFDAEQPYFLNVAMSSQVDFDSVYLERVRKIADIASVPYLHASELGAEGVEAVAQSLAELVQFSQVRFYFAAVDKRDLAGMKFYDAVFDPAENAAAPHHSYILRPLKFILLAKFLHILEESDTRLFWEAMTSRPSPTAKAKAVQAIDNTITRVESLPDARSRQLIGDTLLWARNNINRFSMWMPRKRDRYGHLPNLFTFPALLSSISDNAKAWNSSIDKIIHDRQGQFGQTLQQWHSLFAKRTQPERIVHFGDTPIRFADIRNSEFEMMESRSSPGLQLVDVVLWTFGRSFAGKSLGPMAQQLLEYCFSPDDIYMMSLGTIIEETEESVATLMSLPLSEDRLLDAMAFVRKIEERRQERMRDGSVCH